MTPSRHDRAELFRALHRAGDPIVLVNAWDAASARISEAAGVKAVATTSAGVAWSLGAPDGDRLGRVRAVEAIARIVAAVDVPVTADVENGYAADAEGVAMTIGDVLQAGAVGVNIEDAVYAGPRPLRDTPDQVERIVAARAAADSAHVPLFINVRTDTYLRQAGDPAARLDATLTRAAAYLGAGANGIFVPGVGDIATIAELVNGIAGPVNVMVGPESPPVAELAAVGVARVSLGSSVAAAAYGLVQRAVIEALTSGSYAALDAAIDYGELNGLLG
jgi:2-methylisocitrate lyase-like PEP mutase family enzyme